MKLDFNLIMKILHAVDTVEKTVKGSGTKREKAIALATEGEDLALTLKPGLKDKIGGVIDAVVAVHNTAAGR